MRVPAATAAAAAAAAAAATGGGGPRHGASNSSSGTTSSNSAMATAGSASAPAVALAVVSTSTNPVAAAAARRRPSSTSRAARGKERASSGTGAAEPSNSDDEVAAPPACAGVGPALPHLTIGDETNFGNPPSAGGSGAREREREKLYERAMRKTHGYFIRRVKADGACLFRAAADQIYGDEEMHAAVRREVVEHLVRAGGTSATRREENLCT